MYHDDIVYDPLNKVVSQYPNILINVIIWLMIHIIYLITLFVVLFSV